MRHTVAGLILILTSVGGSAPMRIAVAVFAVLAVIGVAVAVTRQVPGHEIATAVGLGCLLGARRRG